MSCESKFPNNNHHLVKEEERHETENHSQFISKIFLLHGYEFDAVEN